MKMFETGRQVRHGLVSGGAILAAMLAADLAAAAPVAGLPADLGIGVSGTIASVPGAQLFHVQCGSQDGEGSCFEPIEAPRSNPATPVTENTTQEVVDVISTAKDTCSDDWINETYRIDCIRQTLLLAAAKLPTRGDYALSRLRWSVPPTSWTRSSSRTAARHPAPCHRTPRPDDLRSTLPPLAPWIPRHRSKRWLKLAVLEEAETILLRSSTSLRRLEHYQQVAQAIDSTAMLLRSS